MNQYSVVAQISRYGLFGVTGTAVVAMVGCDATRSRDTTRHGNAYGDLGGGATHGTISQRNDSAELSNSGPYQHEC